MQATTGELLQAWQTNPDGTENFSPPQARPTETTFRHSGWQARRTKIRRAIEKTSSAWRRLERFDCCGACAVVEVSESTGKARITSWHCHDRLCTPCQSRKAREIRQLIEQNVGDQPSRFITLTIDHRPEPLKTSLERLRDGFTRIRKTKLWKKSIVGGIAVVEVTVGTDGKWHPHLHIITTGEFLPQEELKNAWKAATGTACIVDIRLIHRQEAATAYVTKYVSKPVDSSVVNDEEKLVEYVEAMKGQRSYTRIGKWTPLAEDPQADDPGDWKPRCTIIHFWQAYTECEPWALDIAKALHVRDPEADPPRNKPIKPTAETAPAAG